MPEQDAGDLSHTVTCLSQNGKFKRDRVGGEGSLFGSITITVTSAIIMRITNAITQCTPSLHLNRSLPESR
eukprot:9471082-Pyramimonas_sp.AAC.1